MITTTTDELDVEVLKYAAYTLTFGTQLSPKYAQVVVQLLVHTVLPSLKTSDASVYALLLRSSSATSGGSQTGQQSHMDASPLTLTYVDSSLEPIRVHPIQSILNPVVHAAFASMIAEVDAAHASEEWVRV